jgi:hypothetical protein
LATPDLGNLVAFAGCDAVVLHLLLFPRVMVWVAAPCSAARRRGWISTLRLGLASAVGKEHTVQQMSLAPLVSMAGTEFLRPSTCRELGWFAKLGYEGV